MRTLDFSPLFRHTVGFDRLQNLAHASLRGNRGDSGYPPYNIEQFGDDGYRITMAVAGFGENDLDVTMKENTLVVSGKLPESEEITYIHRGIAGRAFERHFELADHVKVTDANLVSGLLQIELMREVPEEKKPRKILINTKSIPHQKAA